MSLSLPHFILFIMFEMLGLDWLVRLHSRISVGATRGSVLDRDTLQSSSLTFHILSFLFPFTLAKTQQSPT